MPDDNPTREVVKPDVIDVLFFTMQRFGRPDRNYSKQDLENNESLSIITNLRLPVKIREALATPYTKICVDNHRGERVKTSESKDADTIEKAINLVHTKANLKK